MSSKESSKESIKRHPYRTAAGVTALAVGVAAAQIIKFGYQMSPTYDIPPDACVSPWAVSDTYVSPDTSVFWETYSGFNTPGVIAQRNALITGEYGVQASFKAPDDGSYQWEANASDMIAGGPQGQVRLKMAVGSGLVQFAVRTVASENWSQDACNRAPTISFTPVDQEEYFRTLAPQPWANPSSVAANVIGAVAG